jgi:hypothetical protein
VVAVSSVETSKFQYQRILQIFSGSEILIIDKLEGAMQLRDLFETFLREKTFIKNASPLTIKAFRLTFQPFTKCMGEREFAELNIDFLKEFVIKLRELPIAPITCNMSSER